MSLDSACRLPRGGPAGRRFGGFCESTYEIDRVWLLAQGHLPYVGFEWPFGVLFLYGPLWLSHLFHGDIAQGYNAFWTLSSVAGVALLFATINRLDYPTPRKTSIFLILFAAFLPSVLGMGAHYTLLRYIAPFYCILIVTPGERRQHAAESPTTGRRSGRLFHGHASADFSRDGNRPRVRLLDSSVSPQVGNQPRRVASIAVCSNAGGPRGAFCRRAEAASAGHTDRLRGRRRQLSHSLLVPRLFFYAVVFVCACSVVRRWAEPSLSDNSIALIVLSIPLLAAALGRCDPGHILSNGVGPMIAVFLYASGSPRMWRLYRNSFLVAMIAIPGYTVYRGFLPRLGMAAMRDGRARDHARRQRPARVHRSVRHPPHATLRLQEQMALASWRGSEFHVVPATIDFASLYPGLDVARPDGVTSRRRSATSPTASARTTPAPWTTATTRGWKTPTLRLPCKERSTG